MSITLLAAAVFTAALLLFLGVQPLLVRDAAWRARVDPGRYGAADLAAAPRQPADQDGDAPVRGGFLGRLEMEARRAGLQVTGPQLLAAALLAGAMGAGLAYTLVPRWHVALLASLVGTLVPRLWIARARRQRADAFSQALDGALGVLSSALRAGSSLAQAIGRAAEQADEPVRSELLRAARAIALGATAAEALASVSNRVESREWELVAVATTILTRTGGNLAEVYSQIAGTIRARRAARKAVLAQTAQIRMTAGMVGIMPVGVTLVIRAMNPGYFDPMLSSPLGLAVFAAAFALIAVGWMWIRSMANMAPD